MKYQQNFLLSFYLNCGRDENRRRGIQNRLLDHGLKEVKRFPAIHPSRVKKLRGYADAVSYAHALTLRLAIREAGRRGAPSVMLFHDEAALHPQFTKWLGKIRLPEDWGIFQLGAEHLEPPSPAGPGLVKSLRASSTYALAVKAPFYRAVMKALKGARGLPYGFKATADLRLAVLQREIPSYAPFPNLAWPEGGRSPSTLDGYDEDGWQRGAKPLVLKAVQESLKVKPWREDKFKPAVPAGAGKVAFLFLTRGALNQPTIWEEYFRSCPGRVSVHTHPKERDMRAPDWFQKTYLPKSLPTAWGDISLVKAQLALLKTAFRDPGNQAFIFASESCVPIKPLSEFLARCEQGGWMGMMKLEKPEDVIAYDVSKAKRYKAVPQLPPWLWKLHSQWILLNREMAQLILEQDLTALFAGSFAPDESYFGTVLALKGYPLEGKCLPLDPTWVSWETQPSRHPKEMTVISEQEAMTFRLGSHCFARKFSARGNIAKWGLHRE